jgi:hypothetical protein
MEIKHYLTGIDLREHQVYGFNASYISPDKVVVGRAFLDEVMTYFLVFDDILVY